jgi:hypothetical protein
VVEMRWAGGKLTEAVLRSAAGGRVNVRVAGEAAARTVELPAGVAVRVAGR